MQYMLIVLIFALSACASNPRPYVPCQGHTASEFVSWHN